MGPFVRTEGALSMASKPPSMEASPPPIRPRNFRWIVEGRLAGSGLPDIPNHIVWMAEAGVRAIVSATPMSGAAERKARELGIEVLSLPIEDFGIPTAEQIDEFLAWTDARLAADQPVLVHCFAGIGRTGTLCSLWLVHHGASADEALEKVGVESHPQRVLLREREERRLSGG